MIKKNSGFLTRMSKEINGLFKENTIGGMHLMQRMDDKLAEKMQNKSDKDIER